MTRECDRALLTLAGLCGAAGVALAAAGSHRADQNLALAGNFLLVHAPALIGLSLVPRRLATLAGWVLVAALVLFCGDLSSLGLLGHALFPLAAPLGGAGLMLGWLLVVAAALFGSGREGR
jgi:uncharacterized membrane protein YgdD (TMEM256/DUF423 family)